MKCRKCTYEWYNRVEAPKSCPRCKRRFDNIFNKRVMVTA